MPRKQPVEELTEPKREEPQAPPPALGAHVLTALGRPDDLLRVHVRELWQDHYRVNVYVGPNAACARVAHSYFVVSDTEGQIVAATPLITRQYGTAPASYAGAEA